MSDEKDRFGTHERTYDSEALRHIADKRHEQLAADRERNVSERNHERDAEHAKHEALEQAVATEKVDGKLRRHDESPTERRGPASKRERDASYRATMHEVRSQMSAPSRVFSDIIHNPTVERVSDAVGGTIARPNAVLSGAVFAFLFTLSIYLIARFNGYPLSGSETIASFILGWLVGLVFDYLRLVVLGKK